MPLVVGEVHPLFSGFYNWVFVVLKPLGGWRHEVDLTHLKFVSLISVTIETMDSEKIHWDSDAKKSTILAFLNLSDAK